jgi:galactonate dehydratase
MSENSELYLPRCPLKESIRITAIETVVPDKLMPHLMLLRVHTDAGIIGHGETAYAPQAVASLLHDWMAQRLIGADALAIESHWRFFYERFANFGVRGAELRAISALDLALWDILGQVCDMPVYRLLGGPVRDKVEVYNSCGSPYYGNVVSDDVILRGQGNWPGYGGLGEPGPLSDSYNLFHSPAELARELVAEGYTAMKTWPFDSAAHRHGGMRISLQDIEAAMRPLRAIRDAVGDQLEILVDGHGFFMLPAALRIAEALREIKPLWLEDILKVDNIETLADFRRQSGLPISASEMLLSRADFARALETKAVDYVMIDPTWVGGISETLRIANLAQTYNIPVSMHDCTGPLTVYAGLHVSAANAACCFQETVRAHIRTIYPHLIDSNVEIADGYAALPQGGGLGVRLQPGLFSSEFTTYRATGCLL